MAQYVGFGDTSYYPVDKNRVSTWAVYLGNRALKSNQANKSQFYKNYKIYKIWIMEVV